MLTSQIDGSEEDPLDADFSAAFEFNLRELLEAESDPRTMSTAPSTPNQPAPPPPSPGDLIWHHSHLPQVAQKRPRPRSDVSQRKQREREKEAALEGNRSRNPEQAERDRLRARKLRTETKHTIVSLRSLGAELNAKLERVKVEQAKQQEASDAKLAKQVQELQEQKQQLAFTRSLKRWPAENVVSGMRETAVSCTDKVFMSTYFDAMWTCVNTYLTNDGVGIFARGAFAPSREEVRGVNRFVWRMVDHAKFHDDEHCQGFWAGVQYIKDQFVGHTLRDCKHSDVSNQGDIYILDSGDCDAWFTECTRERYKHRDYDAGRGNSISVMLALEDDCIVVLVSKDSELVLHVPKGGFAIWNAAVYHVGASHMDFCGRAVSACRRRVFFYFDDSRYVDGTGVVVHPKDKDGAQLFETHIPAPNDYDCLVYENISSLSAAYHLLSSRHLEGRLLVSEVSTAGPLWNCGEIGLPC